jgi:hypothetical protein
VVLAVLTVDPGDPTTTSRWRANDQARAIIGIRIHSFESVVFGRIDLLEDLTKLGQSYGKLPRKFMKPVT